MDKPQGLGFDGWLKKLKSEFPSPAGEEDFDPTQPMDDLAKMRRLMAIDRRYMYAMAGARMGRTDATSVQQFKSIVGDYEQLLKAGPAQAGFYKERDVRAKMADA